jgi:PsbP
VAESADTNVTVIITNVGADYTKLGSFGDAETFGSNLVASMDRSFLRRAPEWARRGQGPIQVG